MTDSRPRAEENVAACHPEAGCITCGDEGVEMRVLSVDTYTSLALCTDEGGGAASEVDLGIVAGVAPGDVLLVHAAVALTRLEPEAVA